MPTNLLHFSGLKTCTKCAKEKKSIEFYKQKLGKFGKASRCIECENIRVREFYEDNKQQKYLSRKKWSENNTQKLSNNSQMITY